MIIKVCGMTRPEDIEFCDALGIDLDPFERPECLEDGRLAIGAADRTMGPVIKGYPPEVR